MIQNSWILEALGDNRIEQANMEAERRLIYRALGKLHEPGDDPELRFTAETLELAVFDLLENDEQIDTLRGLSEETFKLLRVIPIPDASIDAGKWILRLVCHGILGERGADVARYLRENPWPELPTQNMSWGTQVLASIIDAWLRLIRKSGWNDLDLVQQRIVSLRKDQSLFEKDYLEKKTAHARTAAWELVALYHLSKAAEILAIFSTQGAVDGHYDIRQQLEAQFDRAIGACAKAELIELENLVRLLSRTAKQLVDNSIWTITRAVNSRVTKFVEQLVNNRHRPIFEMLPPQRHTLREAGLLGSGHRAVVVNLPTSSGKTFIAQFRILQALNQFDQERGWVAYLAPTRALVNQLCTRLRRDFAPLTINVERVSPALEIDGLEAGLLSDANEQSQFRVLVTTPEKLDLMLRGGWEAKIGRPLTLVVVDEAHNLAQKARGIKLELLLATINRECRYAQFLLLTPFIDNAAEIARWLSPDSYKNIELGLDWQPNDRIIALSFPKKSLGRGNFTIELQTLHTTKKTLQIPENLDLNTEKLLDLTWSTVSKNLGKLAAATAQALKARGALIVLTGKVDHTWSLADTFKHENNRIAKSPEEVEIVQRFLKEEFGNEFPLITLLEYGVGVHHSGLSDEAKMLMEWLLETNQIQVLVATTTIAQGVNFPVAGVVMASHQYPYGEDMPPEDFWNLAGRAGRVDQGSVGMIVLAATDPEKATKLKTFLNRNIASLSSTLIKMVQEALAISEQLELHRLFHLPEWSSFLQYLAHTYRQIGNAERFAIQIEQILRGTLGFESIRRTHPKWATRLVNSVHQYSERLAGKPLTLVDSTGFSWETVSITLGRLAEERINQDVWDPDNLFSEDNRNLQKMMGILLEVPELRTNLQAATGGRGRDKNLLARIVSDWVNGVSLIDIAKQYFTSASKGKPVDEVEAMTNCCQSLFGKLAQTASWGLSALQTLTFKEDFDRLSEAEQKTLRNLPARVYYGVNSDEAIALRLLGVPRRAAHPLANKLGEKIGSLPLSQLRNELQASDQSVWIQAMGGVGKDYHHVWKILEGNS